MVVVVEDVDGLGRRLEEAVAGRRADILDGPLAALVALRAVGEDLDPLWDIWEAGEAGRQGDRDRVRDPAKRG